MQRRNAMDGLAEKKHLASLISLNPNSSAIPRPNEKIIQHPIQLDLEKRQRMAIREEQAALEPLLSRALAMEIMAELRATSRINDFPAVYFPSTHAVKTVLGIEDRIEMADYLRHPDNDDNWKIQEEKEEKTLPLIRMYSARDEKQKGSIPTPTSAANSTGRTQALSGDWSDSSGSVSVAEDRPKMAPAVKKQPQLAQPKPTTERSNVRSSRQSRRLIDGSLQGCESKMVQANAKTIRNETHVDLMKEIKSDKHPLLENKIIQEDQQANNDKLPNKLEGDILKQDEQVASEKEKTEFLQTSEEAAIRQKIELPFHRLRADLETPTPTREKHVLTVQRSTLSLDDNDAKYLSNKKDQVDSWNENPKNELAKIDDAAKQAVLDQSTIIACLVEKDWGKADKLLSKSEIPSLNTNILDKDGWPVLLTAIREDQIAIVQHLLQHGADINVKTKDGNYAAHIAAMYASEEMMQILCRYHVKVDVENSTGQLPLHLALNRAPLLSVALIKLLLDYMQHTTGLDPRFIEDKEGCIPFLAACEAGNVPACKELLSQSKQRQMEAIRKDNGDTALHIACRRRDAELLRFIADQSPFVNAKNFEGKTALHIVAKNGDEPLLRILYKMKPDPNIGDKYHKTPVHIAAEMGHTATLEVLADKFKASVLARTKDGSTLMHIAASFGHDETALALLKRGVPLHMPNRNGALALHCAARLGHVGVVRALLNKGAPIDFKTKNGYTALHVAVQAGMPDVVEYLLGYGADAHARGGKLNKTPLHCAASLSGAEAEVCADMLIKSGADVNALLENGETALHLAARVGNAKMAQILLNEDCDPMIASQNGETALHVSIQNCNIIVAKMLLEFITNKKGFEEAEKLTQMQTKSGETALHCAAEIPPSSWKHAGDDVEVSNLLLEHGADISVVTNTSSENVLHCLAKSGSHDIFACIVHKVGLGGMQIALNKQNKNGRSPLLEACSNGHVKIVELLLQHNARIDVFDEFGKTSLHMAAESGHVELCDLLVRSRAFISSKTKNGFTPLHFAAMHGHQKLVELLLQKHKAPVDAISMENQTPLHVAAQAGQMTICAFLLKMGADATARDIRGRTPLHLAAENDHPEIVQIFLKGKADPSALSATDVNGLTCAHIAAMKGSLAVINKLMIIDKNTVILAKTKDTGSTALHMAAAGGHKAVVQALLAGGSSPLEETHDGMMALHMAAKNGWTSILEVLDVDLWSRCSTKTGLNALHIAAYHGQREFTQAMIAHVSAICKSAVPSKGNPFIVSGLGNEYCLTPLHMAAMSGDEGLVRMLLNIPGVQVDSCSVNMNIIPLHLAAETGHLAVVGQLLSRSTSQVHMKDSRGRTALHVASSQGHYDIVSLLVSQGSDVNAADINGWTPMHFSTNAGHLNVVKFLIESGANSSSKSTDGKIPMCLAASSNHIECLRFLLHQKHDTYQLVDDKKFLFDMMVCGKKQDNLPLQEFILNSPAPVDTAVHLSSFYRTFASKEKERTRDLNSIAEFCENIATDLMSIAASEHNPAVILKSHTRKGQPFIDALIEHNQKIVVSHPSVQRYLTEVWNGGITWNFWQLSLFFLVLLIFPPAWIFFSLPLSYKLNEAPVIKFSCHLVSHLFFTLLLSLEILRIFYPIYEVTSPIPNILEFFLLLWLSGKLVAELSHLGGLSSRFTSLITLLFSSIAMIVHVIAFTYPIFCMRSESVEKKILFTRTLLYAKNQLFAVVLLTTFVHYLDFLTVHHLFGPWAVIIRNLMYDLTRFLVILFLFMLGFAIHVTSVFQPAFSQPDEDISLGIPAIVQIAEMMFFSLFGMVSVEALPPLHLTPLLGHILIKIIYAVYLIVIIIVLINLLIAMMSDTYQRIQAQSDVEWKFGRAKLIRQMNKKSATPAPVNVFTKFFIALKVAIKHKCNLCSTSAQEDLLIEDNVDSYCTYDNYMQVHSEKSKGSTLVAIDPALSNSIEHVINWKHVTTLYCKYQGVATEIIEDQKS
ncbi:Ankyrin-1 [Trichinella nativa]|uniref:Ankyrin-1 n=1 Tax=Trichinella nativa TaxID=6335 RepID=A0A0V1L9Y1_9BILA|nr:Ankyrin-1 [Trichinella nativa]